MLAHPKKPSISCTIQKTILIRLQNQLECLAKFIFVRIALNPITKKPNTDALPNVTFAWLSIV
jgi:hypothetical protein